MSEILQKLSQISKLNVTLPIKEETLQINKINLELQSKFEQFATNYKNELEASLNYLQFINHHIRKEVNGDVDYIDKLFILYTWHNDLKEDKIKHKFEPVSIEPTTIKINGVEFNFEFELPSIVKDLAFLKFVLNKDEEIKTIDVLFYFTFRYLKQVSFDDNVLEASDIATSEVLFKHLDMNNVNKITNYIDTSLDSIKTIRNLEIDARVFFA